MFWTPSLQKWAGRKYAGGNRPSSLDINCTEIIYIHVENHYCYAMCQFFAPWKIYDFFSYISGKKTIAVFNVFVKLSKVENGLTWNLSVRITFFLPNLFARLTAIEDKIEGDVR